ncbi:MAG: ADP-ribosylglycohydrolase family protein [Anaerolineae bacterium]|nr:ADP-ribosylglycohydrolase family protein [Anaerolineae bacterium]
MINLEQTRLFKKVYGCMLGGAIGDALGGPVEGDPWTPELIRETYGVVDRYVPYQREPGYHAHFSKSLGAYTDDTRLKHLLCRAIIEAGGMPRPGDFGHVLAQAYHHAPDELHEGLIEEYYFKAVWGRDKVIFSGEPTNGAIMSNSPIGLIAACRPDEAYQAGFDLAFLTDGYAKTAAALQVAAIAAAMQPQPTVEGVIDAAVEAHLNFARRREGPRWHTLEWRYDPNLKFLNQSLEIARRERDVFALQKRLYETLEWGHLFSEATHTLCVALAMFVAAEGDFRRTVIGCVMYGRDNDSYASVAGALAGAFHGVEAIPAEWIQPVIDGNPETDMRELSLKMTALIAGDYDKARIAWEAVGSLL